MNCPNCGAENDAGARFCASCGTPLESQIERPSYAPEDESDQTILSGMSRVVEEAKTVSVTPDQLAEAEAGMSSSYSYEPDLASPSSSQYNGSSNDGGGGFFTTRNIIIMVVVVIILLMGCCCCSLLIGGILAQPDIYENLGWLPALLPYV